jgi:hypothetical protein
VRPVPAGPLVAHLDGAPVNHGDWDVINAAYPKRGQCQICGVPGEDQRHRILDAIKSRLIAGDDAGDVALDHGTTVDVVEAISRTWEMSE